MEEGDYDNCFYQCLGDIVKRRAYDVADIFAFRLAIAVGIEKLLFLTGVEKNMKKFKTCFF